MSDPKKDITKLTLRLPRRQVQRLYLLKEALAEKMKQEMTVEQLVEQIIDDFLDPKP